MRSWSSPKCSGEAVLSPDEGEAGGGRAREIVRSPTCGRRKKKKVWFLLGLLPSVSRGQFVKSLNCYSLLCITFQKSRQTSWTILSLYILLGKGNSKCDSHKTHSNSNTFLVRLARVIVCPCASESQVALALSNGEPQGHLLLPV